MQQPATAPAPAGSATTSEDRIIELVKELTSPNKDAALLEVKQNDLMS